MADMTPIRWTGSTGGEQIENEFGDVLVDVTPGHPLELVPSDLADELVSTRSDFEYYNGNQSVADENYSRVDGRDIAPSSVSSESIDTARVFSNSLSAAATLWKDGETTYGINHHNDTVYSDADPAVVLNSLIPEVYDLGGGKINLGPYDFDGISQTIELEGGVWLVGSGTQINESGRTRLKAVAGLEDNLIQYIPKHDKKEFFAGLFDMIAMGSKGDTTGHVFYTAQDASGNDANDFHASNVWFANAAQDGVHCDFSWGYKFRDCLYEGNGRHGFYAGGGQMQNKGFYAALNGGDGVHVIDGAFRHYIQGDINDNDGMGLYNAGTRCGGIVHINQSGQHGAHIDGTDNALTIFARNSSQASVTTYSNLHVTSARNWMWGHAINGNVKYDVDLNNGALQNRLWMQYGSINHINTRNMVNGHATNDGDPDTSGTWQYGAILDGEVVRDTTNGITYRYDSRVAGGRYQV